MGIIGYIIDFRIFPNMRSSIKLLSTAMNIRDNDFYHLIFWSGSINDAPRLRLTTCISGANAAVVDFYNALVFDTKWNSIYCCPAEENCEVYSLYWNVSHHFNNNFVMTGHSIRLCFVRIRCNMAKGQSTSKVFWRRERTTTSVETGQRRYDATWINRKGVCSVGF